MRTTNLAIRHLSSGLVVMVMAASSALSAAPGPSGQSQPAQVASGEPGAQSPSNVEAATLGTVQIPRAVLADGERLPAGTYTVRLTTQMAEPVVGQQPSSERWVEFIQQGQTVGRELAPFVEQSEIAAVTPPSSVPAQGASRVQSLRDSDYLRIWFNHEGDQVLVYLPWAATAQ